MAPKLESIKNISTRMSCFGWQQRGEGSADNNGKPPQQPDQATMKPSTLATLDMSHYQPPTTRSKKEPGLAQPPKLASFSGTNLPGKSLSSSTSFLGPSKVYPAAIGAPSRSPRGGPETKTATGKLPTSNNQISSQPLGSQFNPIDLTGNAEPHQIHGSGTSKAQLVSLQDSGTPTNHSLASSLWSQPFPDINPNTFPHLASLIQNNTQDNSHWGTPGYFVNNFAIPTPAPAPASTPGLPHPPGSWAPSHAHAFLNWIDKIPPFSDELMESGDFDDLEIPAGITFDQKSGLTWVQVGGGTNIPPNPPQPVQEYEGDKMVIDVDSAEEKSESSPDLEQPPEDEATVQEILSELEPLRLFVQGCLGRICAGCHKLGVAGSQDVLKLAVSWAGTKGNIVLGSTCQNSFCKALTCLGCGKAVSSSSTSRSSRTVHIGGTLRTVYWCCEAGRLAAIWVLACGWGLLSPKSRVGSRIINKVRECAKPKPAVGYDGLLQSHQSAVAKGVGYGGGSEHIHFPYIGPRWQTPARSMPKKAVDPVEVLAYETYFRLLSLLLPSPKWGTVLDASPPDFLLHILSRSPLLEEAAIMLSNDSVDEISRQIYLYDAVIDFFDALGSHPATAGLAYNDRNIYHAKGGSLIDVSFYPSEKKGRLAVKDTGKPLIALLGNLASQSQTVLRHAQGNPTEFQTREGQNLLRLSQRLSQVSVKHNANTKRLQTTMDICDDKANFNFAEWHRENCVREVPDEAMMHSFAYARDAERDTNANPVRGRMKRLITELSTLQTSLPDGIFIYHGSSRLDIMKILIIGPKHTPYEHGLFEFDLYCPVDYPKSPPKMTFKTTNNGRIRFNPNLYNDGKICLSLLGTWPGEPWRADQSTILQVLVSIQSMILCEQPWYNEPGREHGENKAHSAKYNNDVRGWTMQYAQLPWIQAVCAKEGNQDTVTPTNVTSLWQETARLYIRANAKDILNSSKQVPSKSKRSALHTVANLVATALCTSGYLD